MKRFSVSLLLQKQIGNELSSALEVLITNAETKEEALGKAVDRVLNMEDLKGYRICMNVSIEITEGIPDEMV